MARTSIETPNSLDWGFVFVNALQLIAPCLYVRGKETRVNM